MFPDRNSGYKLTIFWEMRRFWIINSRNFVIPNLFRNLTNQAYLFHFGKTLKRVQGDMEWGTILAQN